MKNLRAANQTWESLMRAHTTLMRRYLATDVWEELAINEYDVLYTLAKAQRPLRLSELRQDVLLSQPALSRLVERLVCKGLITRTADSSDRRALHLTLTESGAELQKRVGRAHAKSVAREMATLDAAELNQLEQLCSKLVKDSNNDTK